MWILKNEKTGECHSLLVGREYTVGRKDCDLIITNDMSISRKHASFKVLHMESNLGNKDKKSVLIIKDVSKLGTQLPKERISNGAERTLNEGDRIIFGTANTSCFLIEYHPIIVTTSCLPSSLKKTLKKLIFKLGGHVLNDWDPTCTFIVMSNLSITIKVASALICQKYIVSNNYFEDCVKTLEGNFKNKLPSPEDYLPVMVESQVNQLDVSFNPLTSRLNLFSGKTFLFLMKDQLDRLSQVIKLGKGDVHLIDVSKDPFQLEDEERNLMLKETNCVMLPESNENSLQYEHNIHHVIKFLNRFNLRLVPESEVGFAVLFCKTDTYCNSKQQKNVFSQNNVNNKTNLQLSSTTSTSKDCSKENVPDSDFGKQSIGSSVNANVNKSQSGVPQTCNSTTIKQEVVSQMETIDNLVTTHVIDEINDNNDNDEKLIKNCDDHDFSEDLFEEYSVQTPHKTTQNFDKYELKESVKKVKSANNMHPFVNHLKCDYEMNTMDDQTLEITSLGQQSNATNNNYMNAKNNTSSHSNVNINICSINKNNDSSNVATKVVRDNIIETNTLITAQSNTMNSNNAENNDQIENKINVSSINHMNNYLTTMNINRNLKDVEFEAEIKVEGVTVVLEADLIRNRLPPNKIETSMDCNESLDNNFSETNKDGFSLWKGKLVANFKRFVKSTPYCRSGTNRSFMTLPIIIGGKDLEPHVSNDLNNDELLTRAFEQLNKSSSFDG